MGIIRKTQSVALLLDEFNTNSGAISVTTLNKRLNSNLNKSTIYRVLDKLEDDGVLHSFLGDNGIKWYAKCEGCSHDNHKDIHPHFQCVVCGKVDCLNVDIVVPKIPNREINSTEILIKGKCETCLN
ncbi:transcriptional repressor [Cellulophaga baltica]|uniref:Fur family transcriptional regulator n=1 Tax=Cellulophaga TaxID=104264 RepID=UPI001C06E0C7|nr:MULTISPECIES: transcriptional repressor [Cellulophaga]MBU2997528.1 transcriptional repressor [Cellulophaga baltica]MDO6768923.1 transcriptional repressor [Cellulophaga sp. 1_MG-2023]